MSFKSASLDARSRYAIRGDASARIYDWLRQNGIPGMVLSTCNRSEIYFLSSEPQLVQAQFVLHTNGKAEEFKEIGYLKKGKNALRHLMRVSVGLESQIPGDFEIIGQVKRAFAEAHKRNTTHGLLERMLNSAIYASRRVKNETVFSSGSSSVSYACVRFLRNRVHDLRDKHILLFGLGKIGQMTLQNLIKHVDTANITLMNKSAHKTQALVERYDIAGVDMAERSTHLRRHDILIIATGAQLPLLFEKDLDSERKYWVLDLSVPSNVDTSVRNMTNTSVVNIDELSATVDDTLQMRSNDIPKVEAIVRHELNEFFDWYHRKEMSELAEHMEDALREIAESTLTKYGVRDAGSSITDEIAARHKKIMFQHFRQFFGGISEHSQNGQRVHKRVASD